MLALDVADHAAVIDFCKEKTIGLVVVGPEAPLVAGLADDLEAPGIPVFGPSKAAAQLEGSKGFTKDLCAEYGIPTAAYGRFDNAVAAAYAAGKAPHRHQGGWACGRQRRESPRPAQRRTRRSMPASRARSARPAPRSWSRNLAGEEASFFALVDGETALPLVTAQDHKRAFDGENGPNTGGMGAYSPAPVMTEALSASVWTRSSTPTVAGMRRAACLQGRALCRADDQTGPRSSSNIMCASAIPECQVLMMRLKSDLLPALIAAAEGRLAGVTLDWHDDAALCVVMAAKGYPGAYDKGTEIKGLEPPGPIRMSRSSMPAPSATEAASSPMAAGCSASPHGARTSPKRRPAPMRRWTRSIGLAASAAATSAGALSAVRLSAEALLLLARNSPQTDRLGDKHVFAVFSCGKALPFHDAVTICKSSGGAERKSRIT